MVKAHVVGFQAWPPEGPVHLELRFEPEAAEWVLQHFHDLMDNDVVMTLPPKKRVKKEKTLNRSDG